MFFDQRNEIGGAIPPQGTDAKKWIGGQKLCRSGVRIREVATAATGNADFLSGRAAVLHHQHGTSAFARFNGAHHAGGAGSDDDNITVNHRGVPVKVDGVELRDVGGGQSTAQRTEQVDGRLQALEAGLHDLVFSLVKRTLGVKHGKKVGGTFPVAGLGQAIGFARLFDRIKLEGLSGLGIVSGDQRGFDVGERSQY